MPSGRHAPCQNGCRLREIPVKRAGGAGEVPVGFQRIWLQVTLDTDPSEEQLATLLRLTERYCVVHQTLARPPALEITRHGGVEHATRHMIPPNPMQMALGTAHTGSVNSPVDCLLLANRRRPFSRSPLPSARSTHKGIRVSECRHGISEA